jgi:hypothetical protein
MMARLLSSALALCALLIGPAPLPVHAHPLQVCSSRVTLLAHGYGSPDDVAVDGKRILFGDLTSQSLLAEQNGKLTTLVSHLATPEGIVVRPGRRIVIAEQGANRLTEVDLRSGRRRTLVQLQNRTSNEGVDGIAPAPQGGIYIPDSPNGRLLRLDAGGRLHLLATGMGRPVGAIGFQGGLAVADETARAVWLVRQGHLQRLATLAVPDDVAVIRRRLVAVALNDGSLWEVWPTIRRVVSGFGEPQGLATLDADSVVIADSRRNALYRVSGLAACL